MNRMRSWRDIALGARRNGLPAASVTFIVCFGLLAWASDVLASEALARQHGCLACHAVDKRVVGPAYRDVAAKYRSDAGAEARLIEKLRKGGERSWGEIFMPVMSTVPEEDIRTLVRWILSIN